MKLGIMQPYFFPYLGYYSLIKHTDRWIVFDTPQFIRHGWIERNRILKPKDGWQYIKVPLLKYKRETPIKEIIINNDINWKDKILAQLTHYKKRAPFYLDTIKLLEEIFVYETKSITKLNVNILKKTCEYLNINFNYDIFSEMDLEIITPKVPDEWALNICRALNADKYFNLPGGVEFFDKSKYEKNGIQIKFLKINDIVYNQREKQFEPGLSIVDVMMFNSPDIIRQYLDNYNLVC